uniref:lipocalin family protein n=1 Tax=Candidatus Limnocylindrus sp. TaxID=2802978 RepID=UPI00404A4995
MKKRMMNALALVFALFTVSACSGPILANPPAVAGAPIVKATPPPPRDDPQPVQFPRDDAPHDRLTEWWYVTGHLTTLDGSRAFGYEAVIFRAIRGDFPVTWASHMALTEKPRNGREGSFTYFERAEIGPQVDITAMIDAPIAAAFAITGADPLSPATIDNDPWSMIVGLDGSMQIGAEWFNLQLAAPEAPVLHDNDGWVDFDVAGGSYYYSRTRMPTGGTLTVDGDVLAVQGTSWFDHQWGDFIAVGGGGWDWFALTLDDGSARGIEVTLSFVRAADGSYPLIYGTWIHGDGDYDRIDGSEIQLTPTGEWTSPHTGAAWPSGWELKIPTRGLQVTITPDVKDQELDTRATTGVIYWEGSNVVRG